MKEGRREGGREGEKQGVRGGRSREQKLKCRMTQEMIIFLFNEAQRKHELIMHRRQQTGVTDRESIFYSVST